MARTYSADELLAIRDEALPKKFDVKKLSADIAADVVKTTRNGPCDHDRKNNKALASRSSETAASYSGTVPSLSEAGNILGSSDDDDYRSHPVQRFPRQWRLQKRGNSEYTTQPYSAPSGIGAQKAENFKKFYEAVVSPSHVRVTAGGRIVPNFRTLTQPMFIWNSEKKLFEVIKQGEENEHQDLWTQGIGINSADRHSQTNASQPARDSGCGSPTDPQALINHPNHGKADSVRASEHSNTGITALHAEGHMTAAHGAIILSPPSQFDASRPFLLNGQLVYAVPPNCQGPTHMPPLPATRPENSNAYGHPYNAPVTMTQSNLMQFHAVNTQIPPQLRIGSHHGHIINSPLTPFLVPPRLHTVENHSLLPAPQLQLGQSTAMQSNPVALGHQIYVLQQQLKYVDNQLLNNKHQIDERYMTNQQSYLQNQISGLQSVIDTKIAQTGALPLDQAQSSIWNLCPATMGFPVAAGATAVDDLRKSEATESKAWAQFDSEHIQREKAISGMESEDVSRNAGIISTSDASASLKGSPAPPESNSRQRLRAAAAKAPPFQPRSQSKTAEQSITFEKKTMDSTRVHNIGESSNELSALTNVRPLPSAENWTTPKAKSFDRIPSLQALNTFHGSVNDRPIQASEGNGVKTPIPYLVGFAPPGSLVEKTDSCELVYSRQLTEEEIRARHLYWGKAPYEVTKGLPKFDGRDFYPPSPTKTSSMATMQTMDSKTSNMRFFDASTIETQLNCFKPGHHGQESVSRDDSGNCNHDFNTASGTKSRSLHTATNNEKFLTDSNDDGSSLKSWGLTKAEEDEIFLSTGGLVSSVKQDSSSGTIGPADIKQPLGRSPVHKSSQSSVLQGMLKNSPRTTMSAATGALSSATARGFLPPYIGAAAASLVPSLSSLEFSSLPHNNIGNTHGPALGGSYRNENRAPFNPLQPRITSSAVDFLQKVKRQSKRAVNQHNSNNTDTGPSYAGADW